MAEDRGGLNYGIDVGGNFEERLRQFRESIDKARRSFRGFKSDVAKTGSVSASLAKGAKELASSLKKVADAQGSSSRGSRSRKKTLTIEEQAQKRLNKELRNEKVFREELRQATARGIAIRRSMSRVTSEAATAQKKFTDELRNLRIAERVTDLRKLSAEYRKLTAAPAIAAEAQKKFNASLRAAQVKKQVDALKAASPEYRRLTASASLAARAQAQFDKRLDALKLKQRVQALQGQSREFKRLSAELETSGRRANRVSFTFRRLFGILAAFTAVRVGIRGFFDLIKASIEFNARIEQATLGVAALLTAVGRVSDATGRAVTGAQALALAQGEARAQLAQLRRDATQTAATFDRLAETFQVAVAPGLTAGLDLNEIRKFTVQISQAAAAIGLPQEQLAEEIRSLLAGTIQTRTTRIAVSLGITNEQIARAKEAGVLAEFLNERFLAFSAAGEESLGTFTVILTNLRDAFVQVLGAGSLNFFEEVKGLLTDIQDLLITQDENGLRIVDPEAIEVVEALFEGLGLSVGQARELVAALDLDDVAQVAKRIGQAVSLAASVVSGFVKGLTAGLGAVSRVLTSLGNLGGSQQTLGQLVETTTKWALILLAAKSTIGLLVPVLSTLLSPFRKLAGLAFTFREEIISGFKNPLPFIKAMAGLFVTMGKSIGSIALKILTFNPALTAVVATLGAAVVAVQQWLKATTGIEISLGAAAKLLAVSIKAGLQDLVIEAKILGLELKDAFTFSDEAEQEISDAIDALLNQKAKLRQTLSKEFSEILDAEALSDDITNALGDAFDDPDIQFNPKTAPEAIDSAEEITEIFSDLPGIISQSTRAFELTGEQLQKLEDDLREATRAVAESTLTTGLGSDIAGQQKVVLEAQNRLQDEGRDLATKQLEVERRLLSIRQEQERVSSRIKNQASLGQSFVAADITAGQEIISLQTQIGASQVDIRVAELELQAARRDGDEEQANQASERLALLKKEDRSLQDALRVRKELAQELRSGVSDTLGQEQAQRLIELSREAIVNLGQESAIKQDQVELTDALLELESQINAIRDARLRADAVGALRDFELRTQGLQAELDLQNQLNQVEQSRSSRGFETQRVRAQATLSNLERERALVTAINQAEIGATAQSIAGTSDLQTKVALRKQLSAQINNNSTQQSLFNAQITSAKAQIEELNAIAERPVTFGIQRAFEEFNFTAEEQFQATFDTISTLLDGFVSEASQQIIDAFDPTVEQEDINARVARFLQGLAKQILDFLIKLAVSKIVQSLLGQEEDDTKGAAALTAAAAAFIPVVTGLNLAAANLEIAAAALAAANAVGSASGGATGGTIMKGRVAGGAAHFNARGYAKGGGIHGIRPKGLDPRDTEPIWAQVGEFMMQKKAVGKYGAAVMQRINQGMVNPTALTALTGASRVTTSRPSGPGYATGGTISPSRPLSLNATVAPTSSGRVLVASQRQHERMLAQGGLDATLEGLDDRSAELNALLSTNRG